MSGDPMNSIVLQAAIQIVRAFVQQRHQTPSGDAEFEVEAKIDIDAKVGRHLRESLNWSGRIQFLGMARAEDTDSSTIALRLAAEPRRFRSLQSPSDRQESDLVSDSRNYILLGDPGAGKTTTLKRVVRRLLLDAPTVVDDAYQFPVVLRLRDLEVGETIALAIAKALGFPYHRRRKGDDTWYDGLWMGTTRLEHVVADFLNTGRAVLILDGLDEVPGSSEEAVRKELTWMALNTDGAKIIVTCRSGDYASMVEGFDLMEICSLEQGEIAAIAGLWLDDARPFLEALNRAPYGDIADRPLLLTQLLFLYKRYGYLPDQPSQVYRRVVSLLLQEWDAERGIRRRSRYAQFDPDRKAAFLAAIAYHLTFRIKKKVFAEADLLEVYRLIHVRFQLPGVEARQVIGEIETHTGIIALAGHGAYEFSHLSLQEYLCADYLIREPYSERLVQYLVEYPAPVAVAVALSSNPSTTLASLLQRRTTVPTNINVGRFVARLVLERPFFDALPALGIAIMKLYRGVGRDELEVLARLVALPGIRESIAMALDSLEPQGRAIEHGGQLFIALKPKAGGDAQGGRTPPDIYLPRKLFDELYIEGNPHAAALKRRLRVGGWE